MRWWWLILVAGCQFRHGALGSDAVVDADLDAQVDVAADSPDPLCFGHGSFTLCLADLPTTDVSLPTNTNIITNVSSPGKCDGDTAVVRTMDGVDVCVIAGITITTANPIGTYGTLP